MSPKAINKIRAKLGAASVITDPGPEYASDKWFAKGVPAAVVFPSTTEETAFVMREASKAGISVTPRGAGYGYVGGCTPVEGGIVICMDRMNRILEINGRDFVAVVQPGVITGELQEAVRAQNLFYPPDPASLKDCSIGGNIATNAGGPRCLKYGVTRHYILGLTVVLPDGSIVVCGGRTHKNKTGFDLVVVQEALVGLVHGASSDLAGAGAASTSTAGVGEVDALLFSGVEDVLIVGNLDGLVEALCLADEGDLVGSHGRD